MDRRERAPARGAIDGADPARKRGASASLSTWAQVERLDTFGAWLLERLVRAFIGARRATPRSPGCKDDYRALIDELHGVKLGRAAAAHGGRR